MPEILPENLDYTDRDIDAIITRMNNLLAGVFPDWTDFTASNFGNILKELFAFVGDILGFYQDNQAKEAFLSDVELRENALKLAKMLGFTVPGASAATTDVLFSLDAVPTNDVILEAGTPVKTKDVENPVTFQLLAPLTIPAGTDPPQAFATVENAEPFEDEFQSTGLKDQEFTLSGVPYLDNSLILVAANGDYTQVDNFLSSAPLDRHFTITVDEDDRATIRFPDGVNGQIPVGLITAQGKTGGGSAGNVEANTITRIDGAFTDVLGGGVSVSVNNPEKASGGEDRMSVAAIKQQAPASVRVSDRTVSLEDYQIGAEAVVGVARALMLTSDQASGIPENRGFLYVVPVGGGLPTQVLKDQVLEAVTVTKPNTVTFKVTVEDPIYLLLDINVTVFRQSGTEESTVGDAIRASLANFFRIQNDDQTPNTDIGFGFSGTQADGTPASEIPLMGKLLADIIANTPGVRKVGDRDQDFTINGSHSDAPLELFEFPQLGNVVITDGDSGNVI